MEKEKAIPEGYMTVGQIAKKMGISVRTMQYYDKEELLHPSAESQGGRRLYTDKDLIKLHQILSLKSLGFSLDDIRKNLNSLDTPMDVADALKKQAAEIQGKIEALFESLTSIEKLKAEVLQMQSVDFKKYADIIVNLQMKNEYYYLIKCFDDKTLDYIRSRFDKEHGSHFLNRFNCLIDEIHQLQQANVPPDDEKCQYAAKKFWELIMEFTNGDKSMLPKLIEIGKFNEANSGWENKLAVVNSYMEPALELYFNKSGIHPFEEEKK